MFIQSVWGFSHFPSCWDWCLFLSTYLLLLCLFVSPTQLLYCPHVSASTVASMVMFNGRIGGEGETQRCLEKGPSGLLFGQESHTHTFTQKYLTHTPKHFLSHTNRDGEAITETKYWALFWSAAVWHTSERLRPMKKNFHRRYRPVVSCGLLLLILRLYSMSLGCFANLLFGPSWPWS